MTGPEEPSATEHGTEFWQDDYEDIFGGAADTTRQKRPQIFDPSEVEARWGTAPRPAAAPPPVPTAAAIPDPGAAAVPAEPSEEATRDAREGGDRRPSGAAATAAAARGGAAGGARGHRR